MKEKIDRLREISEECDAIFLTICYLRKRQKALGSEYDAIQKELGENLEEKLPMILEEMEKWKKEKEQ
jgi:hypothetical protein